MKVLIIIPAYNEEGSIKQVIENLKRYCPQYDYVVVNDGSKDNTEVICRECGYPTLDLPVNLGLAGAFQAGIRYAYRIGYDAVLQFDGDGQHDPSYIKMMADMMERGDFDIVIGSRYCEEKKPHSLRMVGSELISTAIWITTGKKISDPTSGMRMYNTRMLHRFVAAINYGPEPDTIAYMLRCGANVKELQVEMHERMAGISYLNFGRSVRYMLNMLISILFVQFFRQKG